MRKAEMFLVVVAAGLLMGLVAGPTAGADLQVWWPLDESQGIVANDASGNGYDGTLLNGPVWQPSGGEFGGSLQFDGADDVVTHNYGVPVPRTTFSIVHWLKPEDIASRVGAMAYYESDGSNANYNGFNFTGPVLEFHTGLATPSSVLDRNLYPHLLPGQTSAFFFEYQDGTRFEPPNQPGSNEVRLIGGQPVNGEWTHLAVTVDLSDSMILYVNGVPVHSVDVSGMTWENRTSTVRQLGQTGNLQANRAWKGSMDDVAVFDRVLSQEEIKNIMAFGVPEPTTMSLMGMGILALLRRRRG